MTILRDISSPDPGLEDGSRYLDRIRIANDLAVSGSIDPELRGLARQILAKARNIPTEAPRLFQRWIFANLTYLQESPGVELLQGVKTTARNRTVDCDCASIYWAALMRAVGLRAFVAGIGRLDRWPSLSHAVGLDATTGILWELSDERRYSGKRPVELFTLPPGHFAVYHTNENGALSWLVKQGPGKPWVKLMTTYVELNDESLDGVMGGTESKIEDEAPWYQSWLQGVSEGLLNVWEAHEAPEGYGANQFFYQPQGASTAELERRLAVAEAKSSGIPTAVWVIGGIAVAGALIYMATK